MTCFYRCVCFSHYEFQHLKKRFLISFLFSLASETGLHGIPSNPDHTGLVVWELKVQITPTTLDQKVLLRLNETAFPYSRRRYVMIKSAFSTHNIWRKQQTFQELIREGESDAERQTLESKVPDIEG